VISGSDDTLIKVWQVSDGREVATLSSHRDAVLAIALSPNGRVLASGSWDRHIILWDLGSGTPIDTLTGHSAAVSSLAFGQERQGNGSSPLWLVSGSSDDTIRVWQPA
jgi:WD40 repeat protein